MRRARATWSAAAALVALALLPAGVRAEFPEDPPNDPFYDQAEENPAGDKCVDDEQFELFDFIPKCTPLASDPENSAGMFVNRTWREFSVGEPEIVIAYIEGGINWHIDGDVEELANKVYLNTGELPEPTTPDGEAALQASDYRDTKDANGNGVVDPEDLIVRYSDGRDDDRNGYVDDISGWDFYDDTNNPATYDTAYEHPNVQMKRAAAETNNGISKAGLCPECRLLPIKGGAEALDRTDDLAQAWLFAADAGALVINSETADLGYSTLMRRVAEYVHRRGIQSVGSSNDFNSSDHQGGMFHPFTLPGNGIVADLAGAGPAAKGTRTFRERSSISSWGPHNMFSVPTNSGTTSANTPIVSAVVALVASYGLEAARAGKIGGRLSGPEAVQVIRETASDIDDPSLAWPNGPGWDLQFGYGRPNVHKAAQAVDRGEIPPVPAIDSPDWFELADPTQRRRVDVRGRISAKRSPRFSWKLELGLGAEPKDSEFTVIGRGSGRRSFEGRLGRVDLRTVPATFWRRQMELSQRKELETTERFTVTLRLTATDAAGRSGIDRRAFYVHRDRDSAPRFPKRIGKGGGESQAALVDLQGRGRLAIVFGDTDGRVHALDSRTGRELRGWPARTRRTRFTRGRRQIDPGREPVITNVAVGDLDANGRQWVVASTSTGRLYAWDSRGRARRRFPKRLARGVSKPPTPRPKLPFTRLPAQGAFAAPVLGDLDGDRRLEIVQAAWDGHLHVFRANGRYLPGWPKKVVLPEGYEPPEGLFLVSDHKLDGTPALADLDGDRKLEIVQRSQWTDIAQPDISPGARGHLHAYRLDGTDVPGWPVTMTAVAEAYGTGQEFITEGTNSPIAADVDGDGNDEVITNPVLSPSYLFDGDGSQLAVYGPSPDAALGAFAGGANLEGLLKRDAPSDVAVGFTTSGAVGEFGGGLTFAQPGSGASTVAATTLFPGIGTTIKNFERAYDARSGEPRPGFPALLQGLNFVGAPLIVDVTGDGAAEIVDGGDSNALHAYDTTGAQAEGFPKWNTGWALWSPSAGDLDGDGLTELVQLTREGYLFVWRTKGDAEANDEWWRWHHDEHSSGRYGADTRPPGVVRGARKRGRRLVFRAPGDDWYTGRPRSYRVGRRTLPATRRGGLLQVLRLPRGSARCVRVFAVDEAGNRGGARRVCG